MGMLLAFAPFVVFAVLERLAGPLAGLAAGALTSLAVILRDRLVLGRGLKILEVGTGAMFGALALYTLAARPDWSVFGVRLCVDAGLLGIVLASLALGRPFTLAYAREQVGQEFWDSPVFLRSNRVITAVWALAFAVMAAADAVLIYAPGLPPRFGIVATVLALVGAIKFTSLVPGPLAPRNGAPGI